MKFPSPVSVKWLAEFLGAELVGDKNGHASGINEIHKVEKGDLVFVDHPKYYDKCIQSAATFIIINKAVEPLPPGKALLVVEQPFEAKVSVEVHPLNADVWLDGAYLGGSRELTNLEVTVLRGRRLLTIAAPGYKSRFIVVDATTERTSRVTVDLIPDRKR